VRPENQGDPDPFEGLTLDDEFVRDATIEEARAVVRIERLRRIDDEHRRLADERERARVAGVPTGHNRSSGARAWVAVVLVASLFAVFYWTTTRDGDRTSTGSMLGLARGDDATDRTVRIEGGQPTASDDAPEPLGEPPPLAVDDATYSFVQTQADGETPVAYSPCRPIRFVVNDTEVPPGDRAAMARILDAAVARVSGATGLVFVFDGATAEAPDANRAPYQPDVYGDRWAPVLVAWSSPAQTPDLQGDTAGIGGSAAVDLEVGSVYLTGSLVLDTTDLVSVLDEPDGAVLVQSVIMHELGHVVGLGHVEDETQLMHDRGHPGIVDFGSGDLSGLNRLGRGRCFPEV
jgi:hypothetical protein